MEEGIARVIGVYVDASFYHLKLLLLLLLLLLE